MTGVHDFKQLSLNKSALSDLEAVKAHQQKVKDQAVLNARIFPFLSDLADLCRRHNLVLCADPDGEWFVADIREGDETYLLELLKLPYRPTDEEAP